MAFDFKKEFKKYYRPKNKPEIINVPSFNFIAIRGGKKMLKMLIIYIKKILTGFQ